MATNSNNTSKELVGVIGAGKFGIAMSILLAQNKRVLLFSRRKEVKDKIEQEGRYFDQAIPSNVIPTNDLEEVARKCNLIFPVVSSSGFRPMMKTLSPLLRPDHILIHGTKGLDVVLPEGQTLEETTHLKASQVLTMSEVIADESSVVRVGCISGPNLAAEIFQGQPAATVVASRFDEVIREGQEALVSRNFRIYGNPNILGIELAGVLKNIVAIASGIQSGLGLGYNSRALLLSTAMAEMAHLGKGLGVGFEAFLGIAGIGDLIATCSSPGSRNFTVGYRIAQGQKLPEIIEDMSEVAEGVKTTRIAKILADSYNIPVPITRTVYRVLFEEMAVEDAIKILMEYPFLKDVDFL